MNVRLVIIRRVYSKEGPKARIDFTATRVKLNTRFETLYIWTTKKDAGSGLFATDSRAIDFRVKLAF